MSISSLSSYAASPGSSIVTAQASQDRRNRQELTDVGADETRQSRLTRGSATRDTDRAHAVLVVRESPQLGTALSRNDPLRRYLESVDQRFREPTGRIVFATDQFIIDYLQESDTERFVPVYNFGTPIVQTNSTSGRQPRLYSYGGQLLANDIDGSSFSAWAASWDTWLRVTKNVSGPGRAVTPFVAELTYRDQIRRGYLLSMNQSSQSLIPGQHQFAFTMFVIHEAPRVQVRRQSDHRYPSAFESLVSEAVPDRSELVVTKPAAGEF